MPSVLLVVRSRFILFWLWFCFRGGWRDSKWCLPITAVFAERARIQQVQRKVVYYCMWVAEGQTHGLWILMHGSVVSELTAVFWKLSLEQIRLFQSKCSSSEDNNNQMICVNPSLHKHLKGLNVGEHLCPHFWHNIGKISALWDCPCKLPPKSL